MPGLRRGDRRQGRKKWGRQAGASDHADAGDAVNGLNELRVRLRIGQHGSLLLEEARNLFLAANGFSVRDYAASTFTIGILGLSLKFPNTEGRKRIVPLHDLHHVLTGFGTDWVGEAEIGVWELRAGCNSLIAYFLNGSAVIIGLFMSPSRVWRAFRQAKDQLTLYRDRAPYERILQMSVGEVRNRLGIPPKGLASDWLARQELKS